MGKPKLLSRLKITYSPKTIALAAIVMVASTGIILLRTTASGFFVTIEPENGTLSGNATVVADNGASGGKAIQFHAPSPTPSPTPSPPPSGWPNTNNTGVPAGKTLTRYDGTLNVYDAGTIIDGKEVYGSIRVLAPNVIIRNTRVHCQSPDFGIVQTGGSDIGSSGDNLLIEDTEIVGDGINKCQTGIAAALPSGAPVVHSLTVRRVNIHLVSDGIQPYDGLTVTDSYIHDLTYFKGATQSQDDHVAAIGYDGGNSSPFLIQHNTLDDQSPMPCPYGPSIHTCGSDPNNVIALYAQNGIVANMTVDNNLINGGGHCMWAGTYPIGNASSAHDVRITNNHFGRAYFPNCGTYGYAVGWSPAPGSIWSGNIWDDTGVAVPAP